MKLDWKWLGLHVGLPLVGPVVLSLAFAASWWSLDNGFRLQPSIIVDLTPWAIAIYSLTLIGSVLQSFWPRHSSHPWLTTWLILLAVANLVYFAFLVIKRHDTSFVAPSSAYFATVLLMVVVIIFCYRAR